MTELLKGARVAVRTCMGVKRGERVLVVTDPPRLAIARSLLDAAREVGANAMLLCMPVGKRHGEEPPKLVGAAMLSSDIVLAPTTYSISHTQARLRATRSGVRIATMPMITKDILSSGAMLADYREVSKLTKKVAAKLQGVKRVEVTTRAGTELVFSIAGRRICPDTGIYRRPGDFGNLPAGEVAVAPVEGTAEGQVVIDGSMVDRVRGKIRIRFEHGIARKISGRGASKLLRMLDTAGPSSRNLAEFGIGTNPKARLIGNMLEDEKVLGTCHIALGDNSSFGGRVKAGIHVDGIFTKPTVRLDGKILMEEGQLKV